MSNTKRFVLMMLVLFCGFMLTWCGVSVDEFQREISGQGRLHGIVDYNEVKSQLDKNPSLINAKGTFGRTSLHMAVLGGNENVVKLLIAKGADVNGKGVEDGKGDEIGNTPIYVAACSLTIHSYSRLFKAVEYMLRHFPVLRLEVCKCGIQRSCMHGRSLLRSRSFSAQFLAVIFIYGRIDIGRTELCF